MQEDKVDNADEGSAQPRIVPYEKPRRESGVHFLDHLLREARTLVGMQSLTVESYAVRSTINLKLQRATEAALQEGLARYEARSRRIEFTGPEVNLGESVYRYETDMRTKAQRRGRAKPVWQVALQNARLPLYDVQWPAAIVIERRPNEKGPLSVKVGLKDGRTMPLTTPEGVEIGKLKLNDVVYVRVTEGKTKNDAKAELRVRLKVQGAAVVLENKTGRILAMVGGFSYPASQLNRTTQALRQPGSSIKPVVYLAALHKGLQPNTLVQDSGVTLPPIPGVSAHFWSPKNYDGGGSGVMTMRRALEQSKNMVTARLLDGGVDKDPRRSLELVCNLALEARIYTECMKNYPFVLGAQALRMINLASFYASIANEGQRVTPYAIDSIEQDGKPVYRHVAAKPVYLAEGDRTAFYQLRTMLEGTVARGTAASIRQHAGFVDGKTGTTDSENDAWFVGFASDVTVAVWVGYDNASGKRTLGTGETGGKNAVPIAEQIIQATWQYHAPKAPLAPPSAEIARNLKAMPIDVFTGQKAAPSKTAFMEYFRVTGGKIRETQHAMVGRGHVVQVPRSASFDDERPLYANPRMAAPYQRPPRTLRELFGLQRF